MIWNLFRRRPKPMPPLPSWEKDWKAGDRAECIAAEGGWFRWPDKLPDAGPKTGQVLRVVYVYADSASVWLVFPEFRTTSFPAGHFRKLRPCSADFREQLRKRRPLKVPALKEPELVP